MNRELKRFCRELPAIIANAKDGDTIACLNIIRYIRYMESMGEPPEVEATNYLIAALGKLSESEMDRLAKATGLGVDTITTPDFIAGIPSLTYSATRRLSEKLTSKMGRPNRSHEMEIADIKIGALVAKKKAILQESKTGSAYMMAVLDVQEKLRLDGKNLSERSIETAYKLYKTYQEWGCIDEDGGFILNDASSKKTNLTKE